MSGLIILAGLAVLGLPVAVVYLLVALGGAKSRISGLEDRVGRMALELLALGAGRDEVPTPRAQAVETSDRVESAPVAAQRPEAEPVELAPAPEPEAAPVPRAVVIRADRMAAAAAWLKDNWFLAVAALSLALAGIFLVQYGVENGLLTPFWRVAGAVALGLALVGAGEVVRRRFGDDGTGDGATTAFLPSTFSGAGLVVLFAAVLSAHHLYGMIGAGASFFWLVGVAAASVALGWFYGPYLTLVGILGAIIVPFLVGRSSEAPELFNYYFGLIAVAALLIDAIGRWAWVSVLGLGGAFLAATSIFTLGAGDEHYLGFAVSMVLAAVVLPPLKLTPAHGGMMIVETFWRSPAEGRPWPEFPTRLAFGTVAAATAAALLVALKDAGQAEVWLALGAVLLIYALVVIWSRGAEALSDAALLALPALVAVIFWQVDTSGNLFAEFRAGLQRPPETGPPGQVTMLAGAGALIAALALWRALFPGRLERFWAGGAALAAPVVVLTLEATWRPAAVLGDYGWALHGMAAAALMVFGAVLVAWRDGEDRERASYFALAAAVMIAFAMVVLYSATALTLAIAVLVVGAAYADRALNLRLLLVFVAGGAVAVGWRLVLDPGAIRAVASPYWEVLLVYGGSIAALAAAWWLLATRGRWQAQMMVASAAWLAGAVMANVLLRKWIGAADYESHWAMSLTALIWLASAAVQLWRLQIGGVWMVRARLGLAAAFGAIGLVSLGLALTVFNPVLGFREIVGGPVIFDTLLVAYLLPALFFAAIAWRFTHLPRYARLGAVWAAGGLAAVYAGLEIRHLWQGDDLSVAGVQDGELYSYTLALLLASAGLLFAAFFQRSHGLRQVAVAGIALTIAKVFVIDMNGLTGLIRVASFLGLGLSLAGLAWVVRVMNAQWERGDGKAVEEA